MKRKPTVADLFCGIGGFSKGFEMAGFKILFGIDNWEKALQTFQENHKNTKGIKADLTELEDSFFEKYEGKLDVIIAGPPCQGFSMCGARKVGDERNNLFEEVVRAVKITKPKIVIIENVVGLLSMKNTDGKLVRDIIEDKLGKLGYSIESRILNASDFGVPQARKRVFFIGSRIGKVGFPEPFKDKVSVGDALGNIPDAGKVEYEKPATKFQKMMADGEKEIFNHESMNHNAKVLERIKNVPPGGNWRDIPPEVYDVGGNHSNNYRRLHPNKPAVTIKHAIKSMIIHPVHDRVITAREAARLQSFPDSFIIAGTKSDQHQQLANAVPPLLGNAIGEHVMKKFKGEKQMVEIQSDLLNYSEKDVIKKKTPFKFIDLFSGIGGFRIAFESVGGNCLFSSDIDKWANETYFLNFGEYPKGDLTKISSKDIPDHDVLCAGFPCQAFSIAGYRKGFCDTRGTLFFEVERILKDKMPKAFILENVKGLVNHDKGRTFEIIKNSLLKLNYTIYYKIMNSKDYGVPQNRERIYIVGFKDKIKNFKFPAPSTVKPNAADVLEANVEGYELSEIASKHVENHYEDLLKRKNVNDKYPLFATEIRPSRCSFRNDGCSPCLTAKMGTGGNNVPVLVREKRKLTVRECLRIQGFPDSYKMKENYSQSYKQIGNSVTVPVVKLLAEEIIKFL